MEAWKHSQYFFRQLDFLQLQPLLCMAGTTAVAVPSLSCRPTARLRAIKGREDQVCDMLETSFGHSGLRSMRMGAVAILSHLRPKHDQRTWGGGDWGITS